MRRKRPAPHACAQARVSEKPYSPSVAERTAARARTGYLKTCAAPLVARNFPARLLRAGGSSQPRDQLLSETGSLVGE